MSNPDQRSERIGEAAEGKPRATSAEIVAVAAKVALSAGGASAGAALAVGAGAMGGPVAAGVAGLVTLISEVLPPVILRQRRERQEAVLVGFAERIAGAVDDRFEERLRSPEFIDLLEDVMGQAQRATSEERIAYLASLLATGYTDEAAGHEQHKKIAELLGQLTDAEVVWLGSYASHQSQREYHEKHEAILAPRPAFIGADAATVDASTLRDSWREKLYRLDLIRRQIKKDYKTKQPEFDSMKGDWKYESPRLTWLGAMLLNAIGIDTDLRGSNDSSGEGG